MKKTALLYFIILFFAVTGANANCSYTLYPSFTDAHCSQADGTIQIVATNGMPNTYTYSWSTGASDNGSAASVTGLTAGAYSVIVVDGNSCVDTAYFNINNLNGPESAINSISSILCYGNCTGTASISAAGGNGSLSYSWSNNQTTATATGLCAGNYTATVTDAAGCKNSKSVTISQPANSLASSASVNNHVTCNGTNNGSASINTTGGTAGYSYTWMPGNHNASSPSNLSAGNYTVVVHDANNCSTSTTVSITQPTSLSIIATSVSASCNSTNGIVTASAVGGTSAYMYSWSNGQSTMTATGLGGGTYTVTVTDNNGCTEMQSVTVPSSPPINLQIIMNDSCATADVNGSGYTFSWYPSGDSIQTVCDLPNGTNTVYVQSIYGCVDSSTVYITSIYKQPGELTQLRLYPSLANNFITLDFGSALKNDYNIHIVNILGSEILRTTIYSGNSVKTLDTSTLKAGIYFINLNNKSYKFIKN